MKVLTIYHIRYIVFSIFKLLLMSKTAITQTEQQKIGQFIAQLRKERTITQKDLAEVLQTTQSAVARMEKGEQNFSTEMLFKISKALNREIITLSTGAMNFRVKGGAKLSGSITTNISKNATVGLMCAALINKGKTTLKKIPKIEEVYRILEVLSSIGVTSKWTADGDLEIIPPKKFKLDKIDKEAAQKTRTIIMFIAPLMHHFKEFSLPAPGGCKLGSRTVMPHIYLLEELGLEIADDAGSFRIKKNKLKNKERTVVLYESGDTVTENAVMAASMLPGKTTIKFASSNYMVQEVCFFLQQLGVRIDGVGTSTLTIYGVDEIDEDVTYAPSEDPIETMFFLAAAIVTKSTITIKRCPIEFLELELYKLEKMGFEYKIMDRYKAENGKTDLVDIKTLPSELKALDEKLYGRPFPGINMDNLPFFAVIATQAKGRTFIHDWTYENRAIYFTELNKLGANVMLVDMHRAYIEGKTPLAAAEVVCPPALRPGAVVLVAMLAAKGTSILRNVYSINRGYADLAERLSSLGAGVEVMRDL